MARGRRTDPARATLAMVLFEMGFEPGMIAKLADLPRGTVNDIIMRNGSWYELTETQLYRTTRQQVIKKINEMADGLAMKVLAKVNQRIEKADSFESLRIVESLLRVERLT
jgi:hypothetical protein